MIQACTGSSTRYREDRLHILGRKFYHMNFSKPFFSFLSNTLF